MTPGPGRAGHSAARTLAALLGAPAMAFLLGAAAIALLPVAEPAAFAIGLHVIIPLWVAFACLLPLARTGRAAWGICLGVSVPLATILWIRGGS